MHLYIRLKDTAPFSLSKIAEKLFEARASRIPLQYLCGQQEFWGLALQVTPDVLIPRPETEILVEEALTHLKNPAAASSPVILDVATGSGCIALALAKELPEAKILASDLSWPALQVAKENTRSLNFTGRITFIQADLLSPFKTRNPMRTGFVADLIICNPPYISENEWKDLQPEVRDHEPRLALVGGSNGMQLCQLILQQAEPLLSPGGKLLMEIGYCQSRPLTQWIEQSGLCWSVEIRQDLAKIDRVLILTRTG